MTTSIPTEDEINAMTPAQYKTYENRMRRAAHRQGLHLVKSRRRDPRAVDYNTYMLVDIATNGVVSCGLQSSYGLGLDDVDRELSGAESGA